jgi:Restriction endonuclease AspBHI N-terminal
MADERAIGFSQLAAADLVLERIYKGGSAGHAGDDPLGRLLPGVGNQGGFRPPGPLKDSVKLVVLYTSGAEPDWPDALDPHTPGPSPTSAITGRRAGTCMTRRVAGTSCSAMLSSAPPQDQPGGRRCRRSSCSTSPAPAAT